MKLYIKKSIQNPGMFVNSFLIMSEPIWKTSRDLTDVDYRYRDYPENSSTILPFIISLSNSVIMMFLITGYENRFIYYQTIVSIPLLMYSFFISIKDRESRNMMEER